MRYYFLLFLFGLSCIARGQTGGEYRYWFDGDASAMQTVYSSPTTWQTDVDVNPFGDGLHSIHIQAVDSEGMPTPTVTKFFVVANGMERVEKVTNHYYWFDSDYDGRQAADAWNGTFEVSVSALPDGVHLLHYMAAYDTGGNTPVASVMFVKLQHPERYSDTGLFKCWFDDGAEMTTQAQSDGVIVVDMSSLVDGIHTLHVTDGESQMPVVSRTIVKVDSNKDAPLEYIRCTCDIDGEVVADERMQATGGVLAWNIDASQMPPGLHMIHVIAYNQDNVALASRSSLVVKELPEESKSIEGLRHRLLVDGKEVDVDLAANINGAWHLDLDAFSFADGLHSLTYYMADATGVRSNIRTGMFVVMPSMKEQGITKYEYWLNNTNEITAVDVPGKPKSFKLMDLLPFTKQPIRSRNFHFEVTDGVPMVYANNELHARFHDARGEFVTANKLFVDYSVKQDVSGAKLLTSGKRETTARPGENEIKWYRLEAEPGDSVRFKLDRACSMQLFAPSGQEVHAVAGYESADWSGLHLFESGIYYLALHDMTATTGDKLNLDYEHIGKYAVLDYTPDHFSSNGITYMAVKGNGFDHVSSVALVNNGDRLEADTIVGNNVEMMVRFVLREEFSKDKKFDLNVKFFNAEEVESRDVSVKNAITLETMCKSDLFVNVVTEPRVGDPYPITVTLRNKGNVGYYGIPLNIAFDNPELIDELRFLDFDILLTDSLYNNRMFFAYSNNLMGMGRRGFFMPLLLPYIGPYEEVTYKFGVKTQVAHAKFNFYAWSGKPWYEGVENRNEPERQTPRKEPCEQSNIPQLYKTLDNVDRFIDMPISPKKVLKPFLGIGEIMAGIIQGSTRAREDAVFDAYGIDPSERDEYRYQYRFRPRSPLDILRSANPLKIPRKERTSSGGPSVDDYASCVCPEPMPHPTNVYIPGDPNEITGYLAESGSHYISADVKTVCYDIEFENDPEIANSSAHTIVIENQLDSKTFDLSSFEPREISISGHKVMLDGESSFVKTIDLRPSIDAIGELRCDYDKKTGKIIWTLTSLDPMTMEPTDHIMQGILPVNNDSGVGIGHVSYAINLKPNLADGTLISNRAGIVFDHNEVIMTPAWENIKDCYAPESRVSEIIIDNDTTAFIRMEATDNLSGLWKYDVYAQYGEGAAWWKAASDVPADSLARVRHYEGVDTRYLTVAYDMAGNMEQRQELGGGTDTATGVQNMEHSALNVDHSTSTEYDLQGRRIKAKPRHGVYIRSRKKYVAK